MHLSPRGIDLSSIFDFTASTPNTYNLLTNYNDRDMAREEFIVNPQDGAAIPSHRMTD